MTKLPSLEKPSYIYLISCDVITLYYIGIRKERDFETDTEYMSSSRLCKALQAEFKEHTWEKSLLEVTSTFDEAKQKEEQLILDLKKLIPTGTINLSANDETNFWDFNPEHLSKSDFTRAKLAAARGDEVPLFQDRLLNVCFVKKADGTAHPPMMPTVDMTPHPAKGNWSSEMLAHYNSLPPGYYHYYSLVGFRGNGQKRYIVLGFVESLDTELALRITSSRVCKMKPDDYRQYVESKVKGAAL